MTTVKNALLLSLIVVFALGCGITTLPSEKSLSAAFPATDEATSTAKPEPTATTETTRGMTVVASVLHVRDAPRGVVIGYLYKGETVSVYGEDGNWCKISATTARWVACWWLE